MESIENPLVEFSGLNVDSLNEKESEQPQPSVLPDDHPLLVRFQQSLKEHLIRVKDQLLSEIADLDHNIVAKENERKDMGAKLYDLQQEIGKQNRVMEEYTHQIRDISDKRIQHESSVEDQKTQYEELLKDQKEAKRYHNERLLELTSLQSLENNIVKWSGEIEDEVATAKRIISKDWQNQQMVSEEKKQMDMLLLNIEMEVKKKEQELFSIDEQIKDQTGIIKSLNTSLSDATADLEALQQEHKRLNQAWSEVIIAIQHRDKVLCKVRDELRSEEEQQKIVASKIEATKKEANKEMQKNESLEAFKARITEDIRNLEGQLSKETKECDKFNAKLSEFEQIMKQTEADFTASKCEGNALDVQLRKIQTEIDKLAQSKANSEEKILDLAQDQITMDKASEYRMKLLRETQAQRRTLEIKLSGLENQISLTLLDLEKSKGIVLRLKDDSEALNKDYEEMNAKNQKIAVELKDAENTININLKLLDQAGRKFDQVVQAKGGIERTNVEREINVLERQIHEIEREIQEAQKFWLRLQGYVVRLSQKRAVQVSDLQIGRKQLMVMEQKGLKVESELRQAIAEEKETIKKIHDLSVKVKAMGAKLFEKKKLHETEEIECQQVHFDLVERLRDAELSILNMEQEILDLTKEIEFTKQEVLDKHREALAWETKYKMAEETNRWRNEEKSNESEIGCMKSEIHRMEIRYNQLKRAQEKLVQDLDHCVMHREQIFVSATTRQKMEANKGRTRSSVQLKLNEIKNKMKQIHSEINASEMDLANKSIQCEQLLAELNRKQDEIETEKIQENLVQAEIEQSFLLKHQNLENIVRKQHRAKRYRMLASSKTLPKFKGLGALELEVQNQREMNDNLMDIVQTLLNDFPDKKFQLTRAMQSLRDD